MTLAQVERYDRNAVSQVGDRAVVVGGSMAGLCAARVLADVFEEVVVIERDQFPDEVRTRDGAPQTSHPHVMLEAGRAILEDLFPGFSEDLLAEGGLLVDASTELEYYDYGGFLADPAERSPTYCSSRGLLDHVVRRHVADTEPIQLWDGHQFVTYLSDTSGRVTGIEFRDEDGTERTIAADLVVDATGRTSRTPRWLEANGYAAPPVDEVTIDVTNSTIQIDRPPDDRRVIYAPPSPPRKKGCLFIPIEDERWQVLLQTVHDEEAPVEPERFIESVESLPVDELGRLVRSQEWVSEEIHQYPFPSSRWRRYDQLDRFPDGLLVTGDAIASFNPVYGQGMSAAALDALQLHHALADGGLDGLAPRFFERVEPIIDIVWTLAVGSDFRFDQTTGTKPSGIGVLNRYFERLLRRAQVDGVLASAFLRVLRLERPPTSLLEPRIMWRVLRPRVNSGGISS